MQDKKRNIFIFGIVLLLAGLGLSLWGTWVGFQAWLTTTWPTTQGTITAATVQRQVDSNASATEVDKFDYRPQVQYRYSVDGDTFTGNNILYFGDQTFGQRVDAEAAIQAYQPGRPVTIYYQPDNAANALLEPGPAGSTFIPLGFGLVSLLFGLLFALRPDMF